MRDQRLERRLNTLNMAGIVPAGIARDMAVILESSDIVPDPRTTTAIEDAWCRIKTFAGKDSFDDYLAVIIYFAEVERHGAVVIGQSSHRWLHLETRPFLERKYCGLMDRSKLLWPLYFRLIQALDVAEPGRYQRLPMPPLGSDRVMYSLASEGQKEARLHLEGLELRRHLSSKFEAGSPEHEVCILEARFKEVVRHKALMIKLMQTLANQSPSQASGSLTMAPF
jgi:hypothetical protein